MAKGLIGATLQPAAAVPQVVERTTKDFQSKRGFVERRTGVGALKARGRCWPVTFSSAAFQSNCGGALE